MRRWGWWTVLVAAATAWACDGGDDGGRDDGAVEIGPEADADAEVDGDGPLDESVGEADVDGEADGDEGPEADGGADADVDGDEGPDADAEAGADGDADVWPDGDADPCTPNPCDEPPPDVCDIDGVTLRDYPAEGTCTPGGPSGYTCNYVATTVDCGATGQVCVSGGVCSDALQSVRDAADGTLAAPKTVRDLFVTYVKPVEAGGNGFYAQETPIGPGLFFWTDTTAPTVAAGNTIVVTISELRSDHGLKAAAAFTIDENDGLTPPVSTWAQNLSAGGAVDETTESELVRIDNARITGGGGSAYTVAYGAGGATTVYYAGFATLAPPPCVGMALDLLAPAGQYDATYEVTAFRSTDLSGIDATHCSTDDDSNWDFEEWAVSPDPPEDFYKSPATSLTATQSTTIVHDGASACNLTWTTTETRDLGQTWYSPVTDGATYTHHFWVYDNDPSGRVRPAYQFYNGARGALGTASYSGVYSGDATPNWFEMTYAATAPADAAFLRFFLRVYDVGASFTSATVYVDDWAVTMPVFFNPTDGNIDGWTDTRPAEPIRFRDETTPTMDIWAGLSDSGVLYLATNEVTGGWSDHILYVWIDAPASGATVSPPWNKAGVVPGPGAGGLLLAVLQEESTGFVEVRREAGGGWALVGAPIATSGYDGSTDGTGVVEAVLDLPAALGLSAPRLVPSAIAFAVAPYGSADGGELLSSSQFPRPTTHPDVNIDPEEILGVQRSAILVGNVM